MFLPLSLYLCGHKAATNPWPPFREIEENPRCLAGLRLDDTQDRVQGHQSSHLQNAMDFRDVRKNLLRLSLIIIQLLSSWSGHTPAQDAEYSGRLSELLQLGILKPGTRHQLLGYRYLAPNAWHLVPGTRYLTPGT